MNLGVRTAVEGVLPRSCRGQKVWTSPDRGDLEVVMGPVGPGRDFCKSDGQGQAGANKLNM